MHHALTEYLAANQASPRRGSDGSVLLVFDVNTRVNCRPGQQGDLMLEHELGELPPSRRDQDALLERLASYMVQRLAGTGEVLALASNGSSLLLQQRLEAGCTRGELQRGLEEFVHAIDDWRGLLGLE